MANVPMIVRELLICAAGLVTTLATALLVFVIREATDVDFFALFHCVVIPSGAIGIGILAASGYYAGARLLHQPPTSMVATGMVAVALASLLLFYAVTYLQTGSFHRGVVAAVLEFPAFVATYVSSATLYVRGTSIRGVGAFGWVLVALQLLGLLVGAFTVWAWLDSAPYCKSCRRYYRTLARHVRYLDPDSARAYQSDGATEDPWSASHLQRLSALRRRKMRWGESPWRLMITLRRCAGCRVELWNEKMEAVRSGRWRTTGFSFERVVPTGSSLVAVISQVKRQR